MPSRSIIPMQSTYSFLLALLGLGLVHCGVEESNARPAPEEPGSASLGPDDPDDEGIDSNGDGADGVVGQDVYVSAFRGSDANDGRPNTPLRTLQAAMAQGARQSGRILVESGEYPLETLVTESGKPIALYGGYGTSFARPPRRERTVIVSAVDSGIFVGPLDQMRIVHATVRGRRPATSARPHGYALRSEAHRLVLDDVLLEAPDALDGTPGAPGSVGAPGVDVHGPLACDGQRQPEYTNGLYNVDNRPPPIVGSLNPPQRAPQAEGGAPGADGLNSRGGLLLEKGLLVAETGTGGSDDGKPGYGGYPSGQGPLGPHWLRSATGGSGGCPGKGGGPGTSGGSSVGILVLAGQVNIYRSSVKTGVAGLGGDGGLGGAGGSGGRGQGPLDANYNPLFPQSVCTDPSRDPLGAQCAAFGGVGGPGGAGGRGGGGAGGHSIGLLLAPGTEATVDRATDFVLGPAALGGVGNGGVLAPSGRRAVLHRLP